MIGKPQPEVSGSFALVTYVPDPLGAFLQRLRDALPGDDNPQPHITVLPPRTLSIPADAAIAQCELLLTGFPEFEVRLGRVQAFPSTNVLYLDLIEGNTEVHRLHDALSSGGLAQDEEFDFRPHLTLSGCVADHELTRALTEASKIWADVPVPKIFTLREVVGLWSKPGDSENAGWQRIWSHPLRREARAAWAGMPQHP